MEAARVNEGWADADLVSYPQLAMMMWPREQRLARGRRIGKGKLEKRKRSEVRGGGVDGRRMDWQGLVSYS